MYRCLIVFFLVFAEGYSGGKGERRAEGAARDVEGWQLQD